MHTSSSEGRCSCSKSSAVHVDGWNDQGIGKDMGKLLGFSTSVVTAGFALAGYPTSGSLVHDVIIGLH